MVLVALAIAAGGGIGYVLLEDDDALTPVETIQAFDEASRANDCEAAVDLLTQDSWALILANAEGELPQNPSRQDAIRSCREHSDDNIDETLDGAVLVSQEGDRAVVEVTYTSEGETSAEDFVLTRVDGVWKLDLPASAARYGASDDEAGEEGEGAGT